MPTFKGFVDASASDNASAQFTISNGNSPFQDGVEFTFLGVRTEDGVQKPGYRHVFATFLDKNGKETRSKVAKPVLETNIGDLHLSMLFKLHAQFDSNDHVSSKGTFVDLVTKTIAANKGKNDGEILSAIIAAVGTKKIKVTRRPFKGLASDGRQFPTSVVDLDFVD